MKAIIVERYGTPDVLKLADVDKPVPGADEVLIKVVAASLNAFDWHMLLPDPSLMVRFMGGGLFKPKNRILGTDMAGQVEAAGENVTQFKPGDEVFGDLSRWGCGACAEYVCAPEEALALTPANMSFEQAAAAPMAALTALQGLRHGRIRQGQKVLINGASGGVGTFAVQLAKYFAAEVTAVCSAGNMAMARQLGADHVIDYAREDFTRSGKQYDLILATNGFHPLADYKRALARGGRYVMTGGSMKQIFQAMLLAPWHSLSGGKKMGGITAHANQNDLIFIKELMEAGKVVPVIDRVYPLAEVPEALRYLLAGHARGKVVIKIEDAGTRGSENPANKERIWA